MFVESQVHSCISFSSSMRDKQFKQNNLVKLRKLAPLLLSSCVAESCSAREQFLRVPVV